MEALLNSYPISQQLEEKSESIYGQDFCFSFFLSDESILSDTIHYNKHYSICITDEHGPVSYYQSLTSGSLPGIFCPEPIYFDKLHPLHQYVCLTEILTICKLEN